MIDTFKGYFQKHFPFQSLLAGSANNVKGDAPDKYTLSTSRRVALYALKATVPICLLGFVSSFFIQTNYIYQLDWGFFQKAIDFEGIIRAVAVGGLIGYGTNWLAIKMLFKPVKKRPLLGQGVVPAQKDRIIYSLAQGMYNHILNQDLIRQRIEETGLIDRLNNIVMDGTVSLIQDEALRGEIKKSIYETMESFANQEEVRQEIKTLIDQRLEQNLDKGFTKFVLQTYKRLNKEEYEAVIDKVVKDIPNVAVEVMDKLDDQLNRAAAFVRKEKKEMADRIMDLFIDLLNRIDITDLLAKQMVHFDEEKMERMVRESTNEQLQYVQYLGTILGILGGLLIWQPEIMTGIYVVLSGLLFGLDALIFSLTQKKDAT
ncbi:MAG: DUF445 family protein [Bacteroidota bacterium]